MVVTVQKAAKKEKMNLSTTASTVSVGMNDQVVDTWPQVSHTVHVWIGVFIGVSGRL